MQVFLTGATGYIGGAVAEELTRKGHDVLALARSEQSAEALERAGYTVLRGDLRDPLALAQAALKADAVIHTAFSNSKDGARVDEGAAAALILALEKSDKPFIYTSGVWVYGNTGDTPVDEDDPLDPPPAVAERVGVENMVLQASARRIRTVVLRPGIVYGVGGRGGFLDRFRREAQAHGFVRVVEDGEQRWPFVHRHDLAALYEKALRATPGSVFNGIAGTSPPVKEVARMVASSCGGVTSVLSWPLAEARKEIGGLADIQALDQGFVSNEKAISELDWAPREAPVLSDLLPPATQGAIA